MTGAISSSSSPAAGISSPVATASSSSIVASSSSSIMVSSSSSVVASISSSSISSSSSLVAVSSSSVAVSNSPSSATSRPSSTIVPSTTTTLAPPVADPVISNAAQSPSSSASGSTIVITHRLRAARNPSIDRTSLDNLTPKNSLNFYFAEDGTTYTSNVQVNLDAGAVGVLLENIAGISSVTCTGSAIELVFNDDATANAADSWQEGTVLFTLSEGCNTNDERGSYKLTAAPPGRLRARATSTVQNKRVRSFASLRLAIAQLIAKYEELKKAAAEEIVRASAAAAASSYTLDLSDITVSSSQGAASAQITSAVSSVQVPSSTVQQSSATPTPLAQCDGYFPSNRYDIDGTAYDVSCGLSSNFRERWIDIAYQPSFQACMKSCSILAKCKVVSFSEKDPVNGRYQCIRWPLLGYKTQDATGVTDMAVKVVPGAAVSSSVQVRKPGTLVTSTISMSSTSTDSSTAVISTASTF
ncbi:hypothetical protein T440DRAFT_556921 [Plenodomus tracheiphilus IPT5]|uniref:DUF7029 domain-containing protein n=1 Tax=Plenodomus tracheiphilus IPT5 TaxID=1408161 RepID=A0A6A7B1A9_9PLEO|nr:hypothetical protein T440DRAFT_556921 [Plenodomus tracheiphilus IPT5]